MNREQKRTAEREAVRTNVRAEADEQARGLIAQMLLAKEAAGVSFYQVAKASGYDQIGATRCLTGIELPNLARACALAAAVGLKLTLAPAPAKTPPAKKTRPS
jgi:hypothetical protein